MKAIAITQAAADGNNIPSLTEIDLPVPTAHGRDLLVAVKAISVNPVDTKVRAGFQGDTPRVLGWDAVGVVQSVGEEVTLFAPGDEVWYAGALGRAGSNSEYQLVDERLVAHKPRTLDNASTAALPLTKRPKRGHPPASPTPANSVCTIAAAPPATMIAIATAASAPLRIGSDDSQRRDTHSSTDTASASHSA